MAAKPIAIIMCDYWHPRQSANSVCIEKLIGPLSEKYEIQLITADDSEGDSAPLTITVGDIGVNAALKIAAGSPARLAMLKIANKARVARYVPSYPIRSWEWVRRYELACKSVLEQGGVALVVATCFPGECVEAAMRLKGDYPAVRFVGYFLDEVAVGMYRKGRLLRAATSSAAVRFERRAIEILDGAVFLSASKGLVLRNHAAFCDKIQFVDVPFMDVDSVSYKCGLDSGRPSVLLYVGTLACPDRNPARFIEAVRPLCDSGSLRLRFAGDSAGLLKGYSDRVEELGFLPSTECDELMQESEALLSIGNREPFLIPSKLFKYMGVGKPIVHLRRGEQDSCLPYLERYPLSLVVDESECDVADAIGEFFAGLRNRDGLEIPLRQLFPLAYPECTASAFGIRESNRHMVE